ncbi:hypothetical protein [Rhizobium phage RHph_X3_2]|nr:hypothetical protein [Rhizobium phage RHph_X3_2]
MVTNEMIARRIAELEVEAEVLERQQSFGLARVKRGDIKYYRELLDERLARETPPNGVEMGVVADDLERS